MKHSITTTILSILLLNSCTQKLEQLPEKDTYKEALLKKIQPNESVKYWQLEHYPNFKTEEIDSEILFSKGKYLPKDSIPKNKLDFGGFFSDCHPFYCAYRITYFENKEWKVVKSEKDLKKFMDKIENESEAFLIGIINGYSIDQNSNKGNGFKKQLKGFKLNMMKYEHCPISKESFSFLVTENGTIENLKNNGFYLKSTQCIVY